MGNRGFVIIYLRRFYENKEISHRSAKGSKGKVSPRRSKSVPLSGETISGAVATGSVGRVGARATWSYCSLISGIGTPSMTR